MYISIHIYIFLLFSEVQIGFAINKANISENNDTINIVVNKLGDTVLTTKVNLTRSYNTTGMSYNFKLHVVLISAINF